MRVLLAGATSVIGSRVLPLLLAAGHDVIAVTRRAGSLDGTGAHELVVDILDRFALLDVVEFLEFDAVINLTTHVSRSPLRHSRMARKNRLRTEGTSALIAAARSVGAKKFVTASAFYGYGFTDLGSEPLDEGELFGPLSAKRLDPVHRSLLSNEQQVRAFGGVCLRFGNVYGDRRSSVIASDWSGSLPMLHVSDAASAVMRALQRGRPGETYNIADDQPATWRELQQASAIAAGRRFPFAVPSWALRTSAPFVAELLTRTSMRLSTEKAKKELGWTPQFAGYADGLRESVEVAASA